MKRKSLRFSVLLNRRARAAAKAPDLAQVLRGTIRERYVRCGKANCHCRTGRGHGPFLYLSVSLGIGKSEQIVIDPRDAPLARRFVGNYRQLHLILEEVSELNRQLLRLLKESGTRAKVPAPPKLKRRYEKR